MVELLQTLDAQDLVIVMLEQGVIQGLIGKMGLDTYKAYKLDQATTFGEMWSKALNRYIKSSMDDADYKTVEEWQAFGDPTLAIGEKSQPPAKPASTQWSCIWED